jgi:hypothetical protein
MCAVKYEFLFGRSQCAHGAAFLAAGSNYKKGGVRRARLYSRRLRQICAGINKF